ncbi:MAG: nuclear transport factor 2 family protein [Bacteroidota bacterium]|nr:nuclear transport factor 2 family protein [Bacteroidota bacterium]
MTTREIANRLHALCAEGKFEVAQKELFSQDAISIEPEASQGFAKETKGLPAIIEKGHAFEGMVEAVHGIKVSEPLVAGNSFAVHLEMDTTMKGHKRSTMSELCVYHVKDGKIASEEFFM